MNHTPKPMIKSVTRILIAVTTWLNCELNLIPTTRIAVMPRITSTAIQSCDRAPSCPDAYSDVGNVIPRVSKTLTKYPDQPFATVAAPSVNSRMRSQPINHATNSPRAA